MDSITNEIIEEISDRKGVDLYSFHFPYLVSMIEKRIRDLDLRTQSEYKDFLEVDPSEASRIYYKYLYGLEGSQLYNCFLGDSLHFIKGYFSTNRMRDVKIWIPILSEKLTPIVLSCIMEDLKYESCIDSYSIYATHPDKEKILKLRSRTFSIPEELEIPSDWKRDYWERTGEENYILKTSIRARMIYANHDFLSDTFIRSLDMIVLNEFFGIYSRFRKATILRNLYEACKPNAILVTSSSNVDSRLQTFFRCLDEKTSGENFFKKKEILLSNSQTPVHTLFRYVGYKFESLDSRIQSDFFEREDIAYIVISESGILVEVSENLSSGLNLKEGKFNQRWEEFLPEELTSIVEPYLAELGMSYPKVRKGFSSNHPLFRGRFNQILIHGLMEPENRTRFLVIYLWNAETTSEKDNREKYERTIREIHHRMKNQMTILFSFLELETEFAEQVETRELIQRFIVRIRSLEIIQNRFSESPFSSRLNLKSMIEDFIVFLNSRFFRESEPLPIEFSFDAGDIEVPAKLASPLLLALSEMSHILLLNASALILRKPEFFLHCSQIQDKIKIQFGISFHSPEEVSLTDWNHPNSLVQTILSANVRQIHGHLTSEFESHRFCYLLSVPLV